MNCNEILWQSAEEAFFEYAAEVAFAFYSIVVNASKMPFKVCIA